MPNSRAPWPSRGSGAPPNVTAPRAAGATRLLHVAVLYGDRRDQLRLGSALAGRATLEWLDRPAEATLALTRTLTDVLIVCLTTAGAPSAISAIRAVRAAFPSLAIVAYCDVHELDRQALVRTIQAGATDLIFRGIDDGRTVAQHALAHAVHVTHVDRWLTEFRPLIREELRPYLRHGLLTPAAADDLSGTAAAFGLARRTLSKRLAALGAPPPRRFFTWTRLLLAASLLSEPGRSLQSVALQLQLGSANALRQLLQRYAGLSVTAGGDRRDVRPTVKAAFSQALAEAGDATP